MATRSPQFTAVPSVPLADITPAESIFLNAIRENVELLIGARGVDGNRALLRGQVTISQVPAQNMVRLSATGAGFSVQGVGVPSITDYAALLSDVQTLANDVATLRRTVEVLINQIRGQSS